METVPLVYSTFAQNWSKSCTKPHQQAVALQKRTFKKIDLIIHTTNLCQQQPMAPHCIFICHKELAIRSPLQPVTATTISSSRRQRYYLCISLRDHLFCATRRTHTAALESSVMILLLRCTRVHGDHVCDLVLHRERLAENYCDRRQRVMCSVIKRKPCRRQSKEALPHT